MYGPQINYLHRYFITILGWLVCEELVKNRAFNNIRPNLLTLTLENYYFYITYAIYIILYFHKQYCKFIT